MKNKLLLITGASGFLGSWLADAAYEAGFKLIGIDLRSPFKPQIWESFITASTDHVDWNSLLDDKEIYAVCHLAGGASVALSVKDPFGDFSNLVPGTARLALYLSTHHAQAKFFMFSSAAVYGNVQTANINESTNLEPISPYGVHKLIAEDLLKSYSRIYKINVTVLRIFSVYGPGLRKQLIWDVANKALQAGAQGKKTITLFGTGNETRDFIFVNDLCSAILSLLKRQQIERYEIYNIASGKSATISQVANSLIKHLNVDVKVEFDGKIPNGDPMALTADISKLNDTGFVAKFDLDGGLEQVAKWVKGLTDK